MDTLARDGVAVLALLEYRTKPPLLVGQAPLVGLLIQDLAQDPQRAFRTARRVATDRVISTVDVGARHGHKVTAR